MKLQIDTRPVLGVLATITAIFSIISFLALKAEKKMWEHLGQDFGEK